MVPDFYAPRRYNHSHLPFLSCKILTVLFRFSAKKGNFSSQNDYTNNTDMSAVHSSAPQTWESLRLTGKAFFKPRLRRSCPNQSVSESPGLTPKKWLLVKALQIILT